jgi:hypothetical protein
MYEFTAVHGVVAYKANNTSRLYQEHTGPNVADLQTVYLSRILQSYYQSHWCYHFRKHCCWYWLQSHDCIYSLLHTCTALSHRIYMVEFYYHPRYRNLDVVVGWLPQILSTLQRTTTQMLNSNWIPNQKTALSHQMVTLPGSKMAMVKGRLGSHQIHQMERESFHQKTRKVSSFHRKACSDFELKKEMEKQQSEPRQRVKGWDWWTSRKAGWR